MDQQTNNKEQNSLNHLSQAIPNKADQGLEKLLRNAGSIIRDVEIEVAGNLRRDMRPDENELNRMRVMLTEHLEQCVNMQPDLSDRQLEQEAQAYASQIVRRWVDDRQKTAQKKKRNMLIVIGVVVVAIAIVVGIIVSQHVSDYGMQVTASEFSADITLTDNGESCVVAYAPTELIDHAAKEVTVTGLSGHVEQLMPGISYTFRIMDAGDAANAEVTVSTKSVSAMQHRWIDDLWQYDLADTKRYAAAENVTLRKPESGEQQYGYRIMASLASGQEAIAFDEQAKTMLVIHPADSILAAVSAEGTWGTLWHAVGEALTIDLTPMLMEIRSLSDVWTSKSAVVQLYVEDSLLYSWTFEIAYE